MDDQPEDQLSTRRSTLLGELFELLPRRHWMIVVRSLLRLSLCLSLISVSMRRCARRAEPYCHSSRCPKRPRPPRRLVRRRPWLRSSSSEGGRTISCQKRNLGDGQSRVDIVIDPLIDGVTGAQTEATQLEQQRIVRLIRSSYPRFRVLPFSTDSTLEAAAGSGRHLHGDQQWRRRRPALGTPIASAWPLPISRARPSSRRVWRARCLTASIRRHQPFSRTVPDTPRIRRPSPT